MDQQQPQQYQDFIDMGLGDTDLKENDGRFSNLEPGFYDFEVIDALIEPSKRTGNACLAVKYKVISDVSKGRTIRQKYSISRDIQFVRERMLTLLNALGAPRDEQHRFSAASLVGLTMTAEVVSRDYEDVDPRTGGKVTKQGTNLVGETPCQGAQPAVSVSAPPQQQSPPASAPVQQQQQTAQRPAPVAARRAAAAPAATAPSGGGQPRR